MEAAGFYDTARRFSTAELVQCFKVISDNCSSSTQISAAFVEQLIQNRLGTIDLILERMRPLAAEVTFPELSGLEIEPFLTHWHFTVSEQNRLRYLLRRLKTLDSKELVLDRMFRGQVSPASRFRTTAEVLHFLEQELHSLPVKL